MKRSDRLPEQRAKQAADPEAYYEHRRQHYRSAEIADVYDETRFTGKRRRRHVREERTLLRALGVARERSLVCDSPLILDVPAGTGRFLPALEALGARVLSADISHEMLAKIRERRTRDPLLVQADAGRLPLPDKSVDVSISMRFFFHLPPEIRVAVLTELARVSRGCVIVEYRHRHALKSLIRRMLHRLHLGPPPQPRVSRDELAAELSAGGLTHVKTVSLASGLSDKWLVIARP